MICRKCKKEIPDISVYCMFCGVCQTEQDHKPKQRGNGQGTVYKSPSGTWVAEVTLGYYIKDGKTKRKSRKKKGFKTKKEALAFIETLRTASEPQKVITVSQLYDTFTNSVACDLSKSKQTAYRIAWRKIESEVCYRTLDSFATAELQEIVDNAAPSYYTRRDIKTLFSHLYKIALRDDLVDKNKSEFIKLPKLETTEREIFTEEQKHILWTDYKTSHSRITREMLIMLYTGIRPGELLSIVTENVHPEQHYMTGGIKTEKGKNRKIILPDKILPLIEEALSDAKNNKLAYYRKTDDFYESWRTKREELHISENLSPYCCRHTYVTNLTLLKLSPAMLQELVGHEDYETTLEYTHLSVEDRLKEVNRLI